MGSNQSKNTDEMDGQGEKSFRSQFNETQEVNANEDNPLHVYTNYKTSLPIKTFSSLVPKRKIELKKSKTGQIGIKSACNQIQHVPVDLSKLSSNKQNINIKSTPQKQKNRKKTHFVEHQQGKFTLTESSIINQKIQQNIRQKNEFKSIVINFQNFLQVNEQAIENYYQFKQIIGEGAFGKVFRGICKKTGQQRAIKKIKFKTLDQHKKKQFLSEMTLLSKLNHPSIITIYDVFWNKSNYYAVMEYCKGGAVVDMLQKCSSKSEKAIAGIMKQLLSALSFMHSQNIIHRDIKLDNLVFLHPIIRDISQTQSHNETIPVKIIDFGTAVQVQENVKQIHNYPVAGTLSYLAPEVMKGILTSKSDIWSGGVLLAILLTGKSPFRGKNQSQTRTNINSKSLKFKQSPFSFLSAEAKDLISKMLQRNHKKRLTANEALKHPWFNISRQRNSIDLQNLKQLQTYERGNNLISVIESYISMKKVSQEERERLASIFNEIDKDGNGMIDIAELIEIYKQHASSCTQDDITHIVNSIDMNKSGKIDFNQFIIVMEGRKKLFIADFLSDAFDYYDKDKKHYLERQQISQILKGGDLAEVDYLIDKLDKDGDKKISKEQFINYLMHF